MEDFDIFKKIRYEWDQFFALDENGEEYFERIKSIIHKQADFELAKYRDRYVKGRLYHRLKAKNIPSFKQYIEVLLKDPQECLRMKELFTIHTTEFFRDVHPFRYLEKQLLPKVAREINNPNTPIRILSAPCSTGQEVYSIAIIAHYLKVTGIISNPIEIFGVDVDKTSVEQARAGIYRYYEIKNISADALNRNFEDHAENQVLVRPEIRHHTRFYIHDLFKPLPFNEKFDIIFCRNFLIYISKDDQRHIIENLIRNAKKGTYFMFGITEGFNLLNETEFQVESLDEHIYRYGKTKSNLPEISIRTEIPRKTIHQPIHNSENQKISDVVNRKPNRIEPEKVISSPITSVENELSNKERQKEIAPTIKMQKVASTPDIPPKQSSAQPKIATLPIQPFEQKNAIHSTEITLNEPVQATDDEYREWLARKVAAAKVKERNEELNRIIKKAKKVQNKLDSLPDSDDQTKSMVVVKQKAQEKADELTEIIKKAQATRKIVQDKVEKTESIDDFDLDKAIEIASKQDQLMAEHLAEEILNQLMEHPPKSSGEAFYNPTEFLENWDTPIISDLYAQESKQIQELDNSLEVIANLTKQKTDELSEIIERAKKRKNVKK
jgi:chemotaxis methyl-accepting protein methylase